MTHLKKDAKLKSTSSRR